MYTKLVILLTINCTVGYIDAPLSLYRYPLEIRLRIGPQVANTCDAMCVRSTRKTLNKINKNWCTIHRGGNAYNTDIFTFILPSFLVSAIMQKTCILQIWESGNFLLTFCLTAAIYSIGNRCHKSV